MNNEMKRNQYLINLKCRASLCSSLSKENNHSSQCLGQIGWQDPFWTLCQCYNVFLSLHLPTIVMSWVLGSSVPPSLIFCSSSSVRYPRVNKESFLPVATELGLTGQSAEVWYPPGHGDIYASFYNSGLLDQLIAQGKEYIFVSNIDNLGATVDLHILHQLVSQPNGKRCEFIMEVTDKTRADVKVRSCSTARLVTGSLYGSTSVHISAILRLVDWL